MHNRKNRQPTPCGWRATEWRLHWERYCFWQYWTKLCVFDVFNFLHFYLFVNIFFHTFYRIVSYNTCIYFWKHRQASKLGGELAVCPMTIGQGSDAWKTNSYLSACLVMVGIRALTISCKAPILCLRISSLGKYETLLRPSRKPTHVHIRNRTCP